MVEAIDMAQEKYRMNSYLSLWATETVLGSIAVPLVFSLLFYNILL
jgi:hypothetical protein